MLNIEDLLKWLPLVLAVAGLLGLTKLVADLIRAGVLKAKAEAAKTPSKADDFLVGVLGERFDRIADMLDAGDVEGARSRLEKLRSMMPKK